MPNSSVRKYRSSQKRELTRQQNSAHIQAAAWQVFCTVGMDAANVRDIVKLSGLSPGTFYNYFRTKEAIFEVLAQGLFARLAAETATARARARTLEDLIHAAYSSYLDFLQATDGAVDFIGRNQHHIRSQIYPSKAINSVSADLKHDLRRFFDESAMSDEDVGLFSAMIIAAGAEAIFHATQPPQIALDALLAFLTKFMLGGLNAWRPLNSTAALTCVANDD